MKHWILLRWAATDCGHQAFSAGRSQIAFSQSCAGGDPKAWVLWWQLPEHSIAAKVHVEIICRNVQCLDAVTPLCTALRPCNATLSLINAGLRRLRKQFSIGTVLWHFPCHHQDPFPHGAAGEMKPMVETLHCSGWPGVSASRSRPALPIARS